ncbi:MAG: ABC transporter permease [Acidimicrobiales bacterium]
MSGYIARRLAIGLGTILVAYTLIFGLVHVSDGSPGLIRLPMGASPEEVDAENERLGWNRPLPTQYVEGVGNLVRLDFGTSLTNGGDVGANLADRLPVTASLAGLATLVSAVLGTFLGVAAAVRGRWAARFVNTGAGVALALPSFWVGVVLIYFFAIRFSWLPATGYTPFSQSPVDWLRTVTLPVMTLALSGIGITARTAAVGMREALANEHITTLRAVGTPEWRVRYIHALRFASLPVVAVLGIQFIVLFGGSVIIEALFALPGLGQAALTAAVGQDFPTLVGVVVVSTTVVVVVNLVLDIVLAGLDPKLRTR